ncbi:MAG TPA: PQQ-binding-like beta-propeller repeat protein [Gemmataceae bacterium]|jgi:outer membrane protein assembly factor BamB|nr:PQQ-binding-like beta-propeller repeat protein [Gemmataceae bacterium]
MTRLSALLLALCLCGESLAADWLHWRGPDQTGFSRETGLPDEWDPNTPGRQNLVWKQPFGCRSTPLVMAGKVYIVSALNDIPGVPGPKEKLVIGEQVVCFDAKTGDVVWKKPFNVFHTDIVTNRLGWSPLAADPENKLIFVHLTGGQLLAMKADTGETAWEHSLTEEFGRVTGYGGRIGGGPIFDSGLVIVGIVNASWGSYAPGSNRWVAFDAKTGQIAWWAESTGTLRGTYYSNPVVAVIGGQRLMITGGADGFIHAFQVRTGKRVWSHQIAVGVVNPSPVVDGDLVYISHGEENPTGGSLGRVTCLDAGKITAGKPKVVWEFNRGIRFGLASLAIADGRLYVPDDAAKVYCFDAKKGKQLWKYSYGTVSRGAPLIADGKMYLSETNAKFHIIRLDGDNEPTKVHTTYFKNKPGASGFVESNSTPSVADGRVYLASRDEIYCIAGAPKAKATSPGKDGGKPTPEPKAREEAKAGPPAQLQVFPADVLAKPGETLTFTLKVFDANGVPVKAELPAVTWTLPLPPPPKAPPGKQPAKDAPAPKGPPALDGTVENGKVVLSKKPGQHGLVEAKAGELVGRARVRVAPELPYKQDFEMTPVGAVPGGWVNAQGKYSVIDYTDPEGKKSKVLFKKNDDARPPLARAIAYLTPPNATGYTIEADVMGVEVKDKLPDAGLVANRYTFYLDSKPNTEGKRDVRLVSWEALPRVNVDVPYEWKSGTWYRLKMTVEVGDKDAVVKCKVWERGQTEPAKWSIEFKDPMPNREGAAGLYGYIQNAEGGNPGSEAYFDNVVITPAKK